MSLGQRVEVSLTGVPLRNGLWHCYYPGTIIGMDQNLGQYKVALDDFDRIWVDNWRVYPERKKDVVRPQVGLRVDVVLPDTSRKNDRPIELWWSGCLKASTGWSREWWTVEWDYGPGDDPAHALAQYSGRMRTHKPLGWNPLLIPRSCWSCKKVKPWLFKNGLFCAACTANRLKPRNRRERIAQKWILQLGGLSKARDDRLCRQWQKARGSRK